MGPWSEHGTAWYNCSRYEEKGGDAINQDAQSKSRASLERYLHVSFFSHFSAGGDGDEEQGNGSRASAES